jgi:hypothetical protein
MQYIETSLDKKVYNLYKYNGTFSKTDHMLSHKTSFNKKFSIKEFKKFKSYRELSVTTMETRNQ